MKALQPLTLLCLFFAVIAFTNRPEKEILVGNGHVVEKERSAAPFDAIEIGGVFNVFLEQGEQEAIKVVADENLHEVIITEIKNNKLVLKTKKGVEIKKSEKQEVHVTLKDIQALKVGGVGNVSTLSDLHLEDLDLQVDGVGNTDLALNCHQLNINASMVGKLSLQGEVDETYIKNSGVGSLKAFDLQAKRLTIFNNGVGSAELNALEEISITSKGVGSVKYKGNATVKELSASGVGKVKKI